VTRSLAKNETFHIGGITRNLESKKTRELSELEVEIVQTDGWNKEQMLKAFERSWGAFVNTNTEDPVSLNLISDTPLRGSTHGGCVSSESKVLKVEDIHFTDQKVHGCLWFLITALTTTKRAACYGPKDCSSIAEYSGRSFHTGSCP
jgi:hypothetical protein